LSKKITSFLLVCALLVLSALPVFASHPTLTIDAEALEKLSSAKGPLRLEWGLYRNT